MSAADTGPLALTERPARRSRSNDLARGRRIGRAQMESILATALAIGGLVFGAQTIGVTISQLPHLHPVLGLVSAILVYATVPLMWLANVVRRWRRAFSGALAVVYLLALITWPLITVPGDPVGDRPWLYFFINVAAASATIGFTIGPAIAFTLIAPVIFGIVSVLPGTGGPSLGVTLLDVVFSIILGFVILIPITILRRASDAVDASQASALARYAELLRRDATEAERLQVDAIVHDSVLTTLLTAARVRTADEQRLVVQMARNAIANVGDDAGLDDASTVAMPRFADELTDAVAVLSPTIDVQRLGTGIGMLPASVAEAMSAATQQAVVNSLQHAGEAARSVLVQRSADGSLLIRIEDDGVGFDPERIPVGRLGVRVSIAERVTSIGGTARIVSTPGTGTVVSLAWSGDLAGASADAGEPAAGGDA